MQGQPVEAGQMIMLLSYNSTWCPILEQFGSTAHHAESPVKRGIAFQAKWVLPFPCRKQLEGEGMVLPFEPMTMTFKDLHYWVQIPKVCYPLLLVSLQSPSSALFFSQSWSCQDFWVVRMYRFKQEPIDIVIRIVFHGHCNHTCVAKAVNCCLCLRLQTSLMLINRSRAAVQKGSHKQPSAWTFGK